MPITICSILLRPQNRPWENRRKVPTVLAEVAGVRTKQVYLVAADDQAVEVVDGPVGGIRVRHLDQNGPCGND